MPQKASVSLKASSMVFSVKACEDALVFLANEVDFDKVYYIHIGALNNTKSSITYDINIFKG